MFLTIACDGKGALLRLFNQERPAGITDSQWDLIQVGQKLLRNLSNAMIYWKHVKGHQDDQEEQELDHWAQLNIEMDYRAEHIRHNTAEAVMIPILRSMSTIKIHNETVPTHTMALLQDHCLGIPAREHWKNKGLLGNATQEQINWDCLGQAVQEMEPIQRRFAIKHLSGWCGVGHNLKKWHYSDTDNFPRCQAPDEGAEHVCLCQDESTETLWKHHMQQLENWFNDNQTAPLPHLQTPFYRIFRPGELVQDALSLPHASQNYKKLSYIKRILGGAQHSKDLGRLKSQIFKKCIINIWGYDGQGRDGLLL